MLERYKDDPNFSPDFILGPHLKSGGYGVGGDPEWLSIATQPEILDMVEQVMGPDIILWGVTIFGKPQRQGKATPWHQDGDYYPIEPLETCTVWIFLDGSYPENGQVSLHDAYLVSVARHSFATGLQFGPLLMRQWPWSPQCARRVFSSPWPLAASIYSNPLDTADGWQCLWF